MHPPELETHIAQIVCAIDGNETAWDVVNADLELPVEGVRQARAEEMGNMEEKMFKIVKKR